MVKSGRPVVAVTIGDVAGIGPEVVLRAVNRPECQSNVDVLLVGHPDILRRAGNLIGADARLQIFEQLPKSADEIRDAINDARQQGAFRCWNPAGHDALHAPAGKVSSEAGDAAFAYLTSAADCVRNGLADAIATAPLNKEALHRAGHHFPGHTEILADQFGVSSFAMMLHLPESRITPLRSLIRTSAEGVRFGGSEAAAFGLSIAHVTLHTSIESVPRLLTSAGIVDSVRLMNDFLTRIGCKRRSIAACALNPHGGENGLFGDEEQRLIKPAVLQTAAEGHNVTGPLPVDTLIRRAVAGEFDGVVAMYHDQGHIPVKLLGFGSAVNITLGLPIVRTSPTHGTAFDRAWNKETPSDESGMLEAILMAGHLSTGL